MTTLTRLFRLAILTLAALAYPDVAPAQSAPAEATPAFLDLMTELIDRTSRVWAAVAAIAG